MDSLSLRTIKNDIAVSWFGGLIRNDNTVVNSCLTQCQLEILIADQAPSLDFKFFISKYRKEEITKPAVQRRK